MSQDMQVIIKSVNQRFSDLNVDCDPNWSIRELKEKLSQIHPSKSPVQEQKLIFSGRLLPDHLQLKDVFRHLHDDDDGQPTPYVVHFVCNNLYSVPLNQEDSPSDDAQTSSSSESAQPSLQSNPSSATTFPQMNPATDPQYLAQMIAMQQMYSYYYSQYMQGTVFPTTSQNPLPVQQVTDEQQPQQRVENDRPPRIIIEGDEAANNDWLDRFYRVIRITMFLCIVLFYTTPQRLALVLLGISTCYLFYDLLKRDAPRNAAAVNVRNDNQNGEQQDGHEIEAAMDGENPPHAQHAQNNNNTHTFFSLITTFFASLIPDPPPPVNIN